MGRRARSSNRERRRAAKRAKKAAQQALYESWRKAGQNKKSKRARAQEKRARTVKPFKHPDGPCGNVGCDPCQGRRECSRPLERCRCGKERK